MRWFELTISSSVVCTARSISLLDREATAEGTSDSSVTASDSADISCRRTNAVEVVRHLHIDSEILSLGLREAIRAWDVVGNLELDEAGCCVAGLVHVTLVRAGPISVNLVDSNCELRALLDCRHFFGCDGLLSLSSDIDVAVNLCSAAGIHNVLLDLAVSNDGGVLLARADTCAVASKVIVDFESLALTRLANSRLNSTMSLNRRENSG